MVELTDREKRIVHIMNVMNNPAFANAPLELRTKAVQTTLLTCGYKWNEHEMTDLVDSITAEITHFNQSTLKMLDKYKIDFKNLKQLF